MSDETNRTTGKTRVSQSKMIRDLLATRTAADPLSCAFIAGELKLDPSATSAKLSTMLRSGVVTRTRYTDAHGRRTWRYSLAPVGSEKIVKRDNAKTALDGAALEVADVKKSNALSTREPVGMVEIEAWVVVCEDGRSYAAIGEVAARDLADGFRQGTKVVRLVGHTAPPTREPAEVVAGEVAE